MDAQRPLYVSLGVGGSVPPLQLCLRVGFLCNSGVGKVHYEVDPNMNFGV
jgi:hypothetical protein